jgi:anti-anti-sigma factor
MSEAPANNPVPAAVAIETKGEAVIARPQAKMMDDAALKALSHAVDEAAGASSGISLVVIDLSRVQIVPSLALGLLVQMSSKCKSRQQKLKLAAVQPMVRQVFAITRLDRIFDFAPTVDAALE